MQQGNQEGAEANASKAISADPLYVKGYHRRALARRDLGNITGALQDLKKVLSLAPNMPQIAAQIQSLEAQLKSGAPPASPRSTPYIPPRQVRLLKGLGFRAYGFGFRV